MPEHEETLSFFRHPLRGAEASLIGDPGPLLSVRGVSKFFGGIQAVRSVSLSVEAGEIVGLVGPNGAGKTTLFNCICGQIKPEEGTIHLRGTKLNPLATYKRARLGIGRTYQRVEVFPDMSVSDTFLVAERARKGDGRLWKDILNLANPSAIERSRVAEVLELVGLSNLEHTPVSALGLGMCRLVELGRALVSNPSLLLADEPSSGLDVQETLELSKVLRTLQKERGMAVLLVEHDLGMVGEVVDRVVVMDVGEVIGEGSFEEVMALPDVRRAYLGISQ